MPSSSCTSATARLARVDRDGDAHLRAPAPAGTRLTSVIDDVPGAGMTDDRGGHQPIGPAPVISTSSPSTGNGERRMHGVAERIEDRGDV